MAATVLPTDSFDRVPPRRPHSSSSSDGAPVTGTGRAVAGSVCVASFAAGLFLVTGYPLAPTLVAACFVAWVAFAAWRISYALPAFIAIVPVVGLAFWTGWLTFEETDLLILATAAGGYGARAFRAGPRERPSRTSSRGAPRLSIFSLTLLLLFLASAVVALAIGVTAAGGWRFEWFGGYYSAMNSVRLFKSFALALLMTPLLLDEIRRPGGLDRIGFAMTIGLGLCGLAVLQERYAFTGLLSFSEDYRVTAPFWEMHTGGAALDGYLALTFPFAVREALRADRRVRFGIAIAVLGLAAYAVLVTFSRGVYGAVPVSLVVMTVLVLRQRIGLERRNLWIHVAKGVVFAVLVAIAGILLFRHGGYRTMIAALIVVALSMSAEHAMRRSGARDWIAAVILVALVSALGWLIGIVVPKGPYLVFAGLSVAAFGALWLEETGDARAAPLWMLAAWPCLAVATVHVGAYWGGSEARDDSVVVMMAVVAAVLLLSRTRRSILPAQRRERLAVIAATAVLFGIIAVFTGGAYMGGRFSTTDSDLQGRIAHWRGGLARLHGTDWLFGKGLGRFPASSLYEAEDGSTPGRADVVSKGGEHFVALSTTRMNYVNFEEWFRMSQRVIVQANTSYHLILSARALEESYLHVELCEQQLLYHGECRFASIKVPAGTGAWTDFSDVMASGSIGAWRGAGTRPLFFAIANKESKAVIDIRAVHLIGPDGRDVLANGDFSHGLERWFSTSNRSHLPWHIKNLALAVLFDQGLIGLALFGFLVGGALLRTAAGRANWHPDAPVVAAAVIGYLIVGATDSLVDVPRVAFLFYLVVIIGLALRNPRVDRARDAGSQEPLPAVERSDASSRADPSPPRPDESRAARRQRAFGRRRPNPSA